MKNILVMTIAMLMASCKPHTDVYRYISLEANEQLVEVSQGKVDNTKVELEEEIVLSYKLSAKNHSISLTIDNNGLMPNMVISTASRDGEKLLKLVPKRFRRNERNSTPQCNLSYIVRDETTFQVVVPKCFELKGKNYISFDAIFDSEVVEEMDLKFTIKEAGKFQIFDGI